MPLTLRLAARCLLCFVACLVFPFALLWEQWHFGYMLKKSGQNGYMFGGRNPPFPGDGDGTPLLVAVCTLSRFLKFQYISSLESD